MICPKCGGPTKICDTRFDANENEVFRRHICKECEHETYTIEFEVEKDNKFVDLWRGLHRGSR